MLTSFINYLKYERRYSDLTIKAYEKDLRHFMENQGLGGQESSLDLSEIGVQEIRGWIYSLAEAGLGNRSINRYISALRSFFHFLVRSGAVQDNPMSSIKNLKTKKSLPEVLTAKEMQRLFDLLDSDLTSDVTIPDRDKLIVQLLYETGMRRSELIHLKVGDIDKERCLLKVLGKGNKLRLVPLRNEFLNQLWTYSLRGSTETTNRDADDFIFTKKGKKMDPKDVYSIVDNLLSLVTSKKKTSPHVLRHSFATHMLDKGAEIQSIKELLGHASLAATQVYTHNSIESLKRAYGSHPLIKEDGQ